MASNAITRPQRETYFAKAAYIAAREVGRPAAFILALGAVIVWALAGPIFNYSDTWQLVINTGTTIVTFLIIFLVQNTQNRDAAAIQLKLDELIRVTRARNSFVGLEHLTDEELAEIKTRFERRTREEPPPGQRGRLEERDE